MKKLDITEMHIFSITNEILSGDMVMGGPLSEQIKDKLARKMRREPAQPAFPAWLLIPPAWLSQQSQPLHHSLELFLLCNSTKLTRSDEAIFTEKVFIRKYILHIKLAVGRSFKD